MQRVRGTADIAGKCTVHYHSVKSIEFLQFRRDVSKPFVISAPCDAVAKNEQRVCGFDSACITNEEA